MNSLLNSIYLFLNTNLFQTVITFAVGSFAIYIYKKQKSDFKKDTASSILLEIQNAERVISRVKEMVLKNNLDVDVSILQSNSWTSHKNLFSRDFDKDEWELIDNFYNKSALLDKTITNNSAAFGNDVEQIRSNKQRVLADIVLELLNKATPEKDSKKMIEEFNDKTKVFDQIYMSKQGEFAYRPQKYIDDAKLYLEDLSKITTSSAGIKLKKLAGIYRK